MTDNSRKSLLDAVEKLTGSEKYSDLTITCGTDVHKVHQAIVCSHFEYFAANMRAGMKEANSGIIDLPVDDPALIKLLVQYQYQADYNLLVFPGDDDLYKSMEKQDRPCFLGPREVWDDGHDLHYTYAFPYTCVTKKDDSCPSGDLRPHHICYKST